MYFPSTDPQTLVYQVRNILAMKVGSRKIHQSESDFLEEELIPMMDRFVQLCEDNIEAAEKQDIIYLRPVTQTPSRIIP